MFKFIKKVATNLKLEENRNDLIDKRKLVIKLLFDTNEICDSILLFSEIKKDFESKLAEININNYIEVEAIDNYFKNSNL